MANLLFEIAIKDERARGFILDRALFSFALITGSRCPQDQAAMTVDEDKLKAPGRYRSRLLTKPACGREWC
jgi:hypothetical protein